jgi:hypothetical protein
MNEIETKARKIEGLLDEEIRLERDLAAALAAQGEALLGGSPEDLEKASRSLGEKFEAVRRAALERRRATDEIAGLLGRRSGSALRELLAAVPAPLRDSLDERRKSLTKARRESTNRGARNAALARASLDAIASVRGLVDRAAAKADGTDAAPLLARVDRRA